MRVLRILLLTVVVAAVNSLAIGAASAPERAGGEVETDGTAELRRKQNEERRREPVKITSVAKGALDAEFGRETQTPLRRAIEAPDAPKVPVRPTLVRPRESTSDAPGLDAARRRGPMSPAHLDPKKGANAKMAFAATVRWPQSETQRNNVRVLSRVDVRDGNGSLDDGVYTVAVEHPEDLKRALHKYPDKVVLLKRSVGPIAPLVHLSDRIKRVRVLESLPVDENEARVLYPDEGASFGRPFWKGLKDNLARTGARVQHIRPKHGTMAEATRRAVRESVPSRSELLILLGHVTDGALQFPDGSSARIGDLAKDARTPIVFLGCNTLQLVDVPKNGPFIENVAIGSGVRLEYPEATEAIGHIAAVVSSTTEEPLTLWEFLKRARTDALLRYFLGVTKLENVFRRRGELVDGDLRNRVWVVPAEARAT